MEQLITPDLVRGNYSRLSTAFQMKVLQPILVYEIIHFSIRAYVDTKMKVTKIQTNIGLTWSSLIGLPSSFCVIGRWLAYSWWGMSDLLHPESASFPLLIVSNPHYRICIGQGRHQVFLFNAPWNLLYYVCVTTEPWKDRGRVARRCKHIPISSALPSEAAIPWISSRLRSLLYPVFRFPICTSVSLTANRHVHLHIPFMWPWSSTPRAKCSFDQFYISMSVVFLILQVHNIAATVPSIQQDPSLQGTDPTHKSHALSF